jgi:hypothetical protein
MARIARLNWWTLSQLRARFALISGLASVD